MEMQLYLPIKALLWYTFCTLGLFTWRQHCTSKQCPSPKDQESTLVLPMGTLGYKRST